MGIVVKTMHTKINSTIIFKYTSTPRNDFAK